jgi:hypothetical protein
MFIGMRFLEQECGAIFGVNGFMAAPPVVGFMAVAPYS